MWADPLVSQRMESTEVEINFNLLNIIITYPPPLFIFLTEFRILELKLLT